MAGFHNVRFPDDISYGSSGGPRFKTDIVTMDNGAEQRIVRWSQSKQVYSVNYGVRTQDQLNSLRAFWYARKGSAYSFRYKDWNDYTSTSTGTQPVNITALDQVIGTGDDATLDFQLVKRYVSGPSVQSRIITKPVSGTVRVAVNGVEQFSNWSIDLITGVISFTSGNEPPEGYEVTAGFEFDVPVRFSNDSNEMLNVTLNDLDLGDADIDLIEDVEDTEFNDEYFYGGCNEDDDTSLSVMTSDITLQESLGRVVSLDPGSVTRAVNLPSIEKYSVAGGPYWYIYHRGTDPLGQLEVTAGGNVIRTLTTSDNNTTIVLAKDTSSYVWIAIG